jgi:hypothetical protein
MVPSATPAPNTGAKQTAPAFTTCMMAISAIPLRSGSYTLRTTVFNWPLHAAKGSRKETQLTCKRMAIREDSVWEEQAVT